MTAYYNENDPKAAAWLRELIKVGAIAPGEVDERDIRDVRPSDLGGFVQCHFFAGIGVWSYALRLAGWGDQEPVWTGSCPCQPFSQAGKGEGFADERHLWPAWFHLLEERGPAVVFGEQVASPDGLAWLDLVQADLEAADYAVAAIDLCAAGIGAPHIRQRLYWVGDSSRSRSGRDHREVPREEESAQGGVRRISHEPELAISVGRLADADGRDAGTERLQRGGEQRQQPQDGGAMRLADSNSGEFDGRSIASCWDISDRTHARRTQANSGAPSNREVGGFWSGADWIYCTDRKYRPVEPGAFPLAHGAPARMGRLRGYGNALVSEQASAFISAYRGMTS